MLAELAAIVGPEIVKGFINNRAASQQKREQGRMDAMSALQQSLTGKPVSRGMAGPPGGALGMAQGMANNPMMQDKLFQFLFGNNSGGGQSANASMPNPGGVLTKYGANTAPTMNMQPNAASTPQNAMERNLFNRLRLG
jgi:hypothetical protein